MTKRSRPLHVPIRAALASLALVAVSTTAAAQAYDFATFDPDLQGDWKAHPTYPRPELLGADKQLVSYESKDANGNPVTVNVDLTFLGMTSNAAGRHAISAPLLQGLATRGALRVVVRLAPVNGGAAGSTAAGGILIEGQSGRHVSMSAGSQTATEGNWADYFAASDGAAWSSKSYVHACHGGIDSYRTLVLIIDETGTRAKVIHQHETIPVFDAGMLGRGFIRSDLKLSDLGAWARVSLFQDVAAGGDPAIAKVDKVDIGVADKRAPVSNNTSWVDPFEDLAIDPTWQPIASGAPSGLYMEGQVGNRHLVMSTSAVGTFGIEAAPYVDLTKADVVEVRARIAPFNTGNPGSPIALWLHVESADPKHLEKPKDGDKAKSKVWARVGATTTSQGTPVWADIYDDSVVSQRVPSPEYLHGNNGGNAGYRTYVLRIGRRGTTLSVIHPDGTLAPWHTQNPDLTIADFGSSLRVQLLQENTGGSFLAAFVDHVEIHGNGVMVPARTIHRLQSAPDAPVGDPWFFEPSYPRAPWTDGVLDASLAFHRLPTRATVPPKAGEWGYAFQELLYNPAAAEFGHLADHRYLDPPADLADGHARMKLFYEDFLLIDQLRSPVGAPARSINGHYLLHHYGARFGAEQVESEIGETIFGSQAHVAFTRGAARQYGLPWGMQVSAWYKASIRDYAAVTPWPGNIFAGPHAGHSLSFFERSYYMSYMSGATYLMAEMGAVNFWQPYLDSDNKLVDGVPPGRTVFDISPLGVVGRDFHDFTRDPARGQDRGIPFVPVAMVIEEHVVLGLSWFHNGQAFRVTPWADGATNNETLPADARKFVLANDPPNPPARSTPDVVLQSFWPDSFNVHGTDSEGLFQVNTPLGDLVDVFLEDVPGRVLAQYPVVVLTGHLLPTQVQKDRWTSYLRHGGTIVTLAAKDCEDLGAVPATALPGIRKATEVRVGEGRLVYLEFPDVPATPQPGERKMTDEEKRTEFRKLMTHLLAPVMPVRIEGDIQSMLSQVDGGWIVTLINNKGVLKKEHRVNGEPNSQYRCPAVIDTGAGSLVTVVWTSVTPWQSARWLHPAREPFSDLKSMPSFSVMVPPGETVILRITQ